MHPGAFSSAVALLPCPEDFNNKVRFPVGVCGCVCGHAGRSTMDVMHVQNASLRHIVPTGQERIDEILCDTRDDSRSNVIVEPRGKDALFDCTRSATECRATSRDTGVPRDRTRLI